MQYLQSAVSMLTLLVSFAFQFACGQAAAPQPAFGTTLIEPCEIQGRLKGHQGLLIVPENRRDADSRAITVHYFHFPKRHASALPPVFVLPGGPGDFISADDLRAGGRRPDVYSTFSEIVAFNRLRDVVIVNQRGHSQSPGLNKLPAVWTAKAADDFRKPMSIAEANGRLAKGLQATIDHCKVQGIDLRGYDILNLTQDIHDLRKAYGYEKIALRGSSFGAQWALAYMKRWPDYVDRALIAGVEPLDQTYDSAEGVWNVYQRIEHQVRDAGIANLPNQGLLRTIESIIERLEGQPVTVRGRHPRRNLYANVTIGVEDFRHYLARPILDAAPHSRRTLELWPKFVLEIHDGDYQYLASKIIDDRPEPVVQGLLYSLIDNSLGISNERERRLDSEPARRWLGDINWQYKATRDVTPPPAIDDSFRKSDRSDIPVLMIHGDLDLATPIENAEELLESFPNGHLIRINGGTHAATHHAASAVPAFPQWLTEFMNSENPVSQLADFPESVKLSPLRFEDSSTPPLSRQLVREE